MNINDFSFLSKLDKLEILNLSFTNISDISFLENNKNIFKNYIQKDIKLLKILIHYLN